MDNKAPDNVAKAIPNYDIPCCVCGQKPTVDVVDEHETLHTELCGVCRFGEAKMFYPENW